MPFPWDDEDGLAAVLDDAEFWARVLAPEMRRKLKRSLKGALSDPRDRRPLSVDNPGEFGRGVVYCLRVARCRGKWPKGVQRDFDDPTTLGSLLATVISIAASAFYRQHPVHFDVLNAAARATLDPKTGRTEFEALLSRSPEHAALALPREHTRPNAAINSAARAAYRSSGRASGLPTVPSPSASSPEPHDAETSTTTAPGVTLRPTHPPNAPTLSPPGQAPTATPSTTPTPMPPPDPDDAPRPWSTALAELIQAQSDVQAAAASEDTEAVSDCNLRVQAARRMLLEGVESELGKLGDSLEVWLEASNFTKTRLLIKELQPALDKLWARIQQERGAAARRRLERLEALIARREALGALGPEPTLDLSDSEIEKLEHDCERREWLRDAEAHALGAEVAPNGLLANAEARLDWLLADRPSTQAPLIATWLATVANMPPDHLQRALAAAKHRSPDDPGTATITRALQELAKRRGETVLRAVVACGFDVAMWGPHLQLGADRPANDADIAFAAERLQSLPRYADAAWTHQHFIALVGTHPDPEVRVSALARWAASSRSPERDETTWAEDWAPPVVAALREALLDCGRGAEAIVLTVTALRVDLRTSSPRDVHLDLLDTLLHAADRQRDEMLELAAPLLSDPGVLTELTATPAHTLRLLALLSRLGDDEVMETLRYSHRSELDAARQRWPVLAGGYYLDTVLASDRSAVAAVENARRAARRALEQYQRGLRKESCYTSWPPATSWQDEMNATLESWRSRLTSGAVEAARVLTELAEVRPERVLSDVASKLANEVDGRGRRAMLRYLEEQLAALRHLAQFAVQADEDDVLAGLAEAPPDMDLAAALNRERVQCDPDPVVATLYDRAGAAS